MKLNLEFPSGTGGAKKNLPWEEYWIFSGTAHYELSCNLADLFVTSLERK